MFMYTHQFSCAYRFSPDPFTVPVFGRRLHPRNAWSLFNAFTEAQKGLNPHAIGARSQALHGLFDGLVGIN